jgi:M6 family metalloprotease-like protein
MTTIGKYFRIWSRRAQLVLWVVFMLCHLMPASSATLADFGYGRMRVNGLPNLGTRPLVVILVNFPGDPPLLADPHRYFDSLIFTNDQSVVGCFLANSNGRFTYSRAGLIGPLELSHGERLNRIGSGEAYESNIIAKAMIAGRTNNFEFNDFDVDDPEVVSDDELEILIISNDQYPPDGRDGDPIGHRPFGCVQPAGFSYRVCGSVAHVTHTTDLATIAHELAHGLHQSYVPDLYSNGCLSQNVTLMSCTGPGTLVHLDPWLKMQLRWTEPRFHSLRAGGVARLPAAQLGQTAAPIILYDPLSGVDEFFMLEYRAPAFGNYDADVPGNGLALWHIKQDASHQQVQVQALSIPLEPYEGDWRWCEKCQGMHQGSAPSSGSCPASGPHTNYNSKSYLMVYDIPTARGQRDWRRCKKCLAMYYNGPLEGQERNVCSFDKNAHDASASESYTLVHNDRSSPAEQGWHRCFKCQMLFLGGVMAGVCPEGSTHDGTGYGDYAMYYVSNPDQAVWTDGFPDLRRGGTSLWGSGSSTPPLRWIDRSTIPVTVSVRPFSPGDASIYVEWQYDAEVWVDFNYPGDIFNPEFGTFDQPYNTAAEGFDATPWGGTIKFKPGHRAEAASLSRRVKLLAPFGPVTIGR